MELLFSVALSSYCALRPTESQIKIIVKQILSALFYLQQQECTFGISIVDNTIIYEDSGNLQAFLFKNFNTQATSSDIVSLREAMAKLCVHRKYSCNLCSTKQCKKSNSLAGFIKTLQEVNNLNDMIGKHVWLQ